MMLCVLLMSVTAGTATTDDTPDLLVYSTWDHETETFTLSLYNPITDEHTLLHEEEGRIQFESSPDGRIAYSLRDVEDNGLYIMDAIAPDEPHINILESVDLGRPYPRKWSPDGQYLALMVDEPDESRSLYLWDGNNIINITPQDLPAKPESYSLAWSRDGRLALSIRFAYESEYPPREIYLWDGETTINLSQNSEANDYRMAWSDDGELAFISNNRLLVWDGVSMKDGMPDVDTFDDVVSEFDLRRAYPTWTPDGHLSFIAKSLKHSFRYLVIYEWDGSTETMISPTASDHYDHFAWSNDGYLALVKNLSTLSVQATDNQVVYEGYVSGGMAWSSDGYLAYCNDGLFLWDRETTIEVIAGEYDKAEWQSGRAIWCLVG